MMWHQQGPEDASERDEALFAPPDGYDGMVLVGSGGFSRVYRAYQTQYDRVVAVKVLTTAMDDSVRDRFFRECALTGRLTGHPHVVTILDSGVTETGLPYLTTEFFEGGSLHSLIRCDGPLTLAATLAVGIKIAGALETAHRAGVHHRDVKPQNILLSRFGEPALGDFGIATTVRKGIGTHSRSGLTTVHAPPEVISGGIGGAAADVYSLASTLYHALAGHSPFAATGTDTTHAAEGLEARILASPVPPLDRPDVPDAVHTSLAEALAKDPGARPATPLDFARELQGLERTVGAAPTAVTCAGEAALDTKDATPARLVVNIGRPLVVDLEERPGLDDAETDPSPRRAGA